MISVIKTNTISTVYLILLFTKTLIRKRHKNGANGSRTCFHSSTGQVFVTFLRTVTGSDSLEANSKAALSGLMEPLPQYAAPVKAAAEPVEADARNGDSTASPQPATGAKNLLSKVNRRYFLVSPDFARLILDFPRSNGLYWIRQGHLSSLTLLDQVHFLKSKPNHFA